jgi:eukaryotic-like serine/threonine-protein kinase
MNLKKAVVLGAGTVLLTAVMFFNPLRFVENVFYDLNFAFAGAAPSCDSVVVVGLDAESIGGVGTWPWPRELIARLIDRLQACSPRVVALDMLFPPKREDPAGNDSLALVFSRVHNLILPFRATFRDGAGDSAGATVPPAVFNQRFLRLTHKNGLDNVTLFSANRIDASDTIFTAFASQSGVINVTTNKVDQKLREIVHVIKAGDEYYPSFGLCAAAAFLGVKRDEFVLDGKPQVRMDGIDVPISDYAGSTLIHFRGRSGTVRTIPAVKVLEGGADPALLRDKLVFVGVTDALAGADFFTTPVGPQFPGVELWATAAADILQKSWVRNLSGVGAIVNIILVFLIFPGLALVVPSKRKALHLAAGFLIVAGSVALGWYLFGHDRVFWNPSFHLYALCFSIVYVAALAGAPALVERAAIEFDVPAASDRDTLPPPREEDFIRQVPRAESASHVAGKLGRAFGKAVAAPGETFSGTAAEEHLYAKELVAPLADGDTKTDLRLSPEQAAEFQSLAGGRIVKFLGSGGMADVYLVWNPRLEVYRAVKVIQPGQPANLLARFETEIRILSKLQHPNIVQFYNVGEWHSLPFIEMEYVPGAALDDVQAKCHVLTPQETAAVGILVCRALEYAHRKAAVIYGTTYKGLIHRDLKPANIMLSKSGRVKLADFGIARPRDVSIHTLDTGAVVGTLPYLAPEQLTGGTVTAAVDIYALGLTLYEFLAGDRAFPQTELPDLLSAKSNGTHKPLPAGVPSVLSAAVERAMAVKQEDRYESAAAMEKDLEKALRLPGTASGYRILENLVKRYFA